MGSAATMTSSTVGHLQSSHGKCYRSHND